MITDELLERGLGTLADGYDVPPRAIGDIVDQLRPADALVIEDDGVTSHRRWPPSPRTWLFSGAAAMVVLIVVAFAVGGGGGPSTKTSGNALTAAPTSPVVAGSGGSESQSGSGGKQASGSAGSSTAALAPAAVPAPGSDAVRAPVTHQSTTSAPVDDLTKIVQTGELDLEVDKIKVANAVSELTAYVGGLGGIVANSQSVEGDGAPSASLTLRVPERSFGALVTKARGLGKVLSQQTKSADVTGQFVDLSARLRALGLTKATYLRILTRASTIGEILSVQQQVNDVQTQIEQLQGQLKVLNDKATYATLTVSIDQKAKIAPATIVHHRNGLSRAVHRSVSRFVHGVEAIVGVIGPIVLVLLLIGLGWLLTKLGYRVVRRQMV
jgi:hypothetical protein